MYNTAVSLSLCDRSKQSWCGLDTNIEWCLYHYGDVIMSALAYQITSLTIVYSTDYPGADHRKHQSSALLALCAGNSPETGEFPAQRASNADFFSIWWRHHALQWRHNKHDGVSNDRRLDCLLNRLFRRRSRKTSKLRVTGLYEENSPVTGEFPAQRASNA